jgi:ATPase subunit of ABC transporter with duplicated ATPase domains
MKQGPTAERLTDAFVPVELAKVVVERDVGQIGARCRFEDDRARRVVDALTASGGAYAIEEIELADCPRIELKDGDQYKEAAKLSTGQRCTTILPILLLQSERPLLVDQPEDNLDNAFIYETVVKALRSVRGARQIIFVTHNPNIPVLGEADHVLVFVSDGQRSSIRKAGTVDDCKAEIEEILEGGPEAFLERKARYGH